MGYQFSALLIEGNFTEDPQGLFGELGFPDGVSAGFSSFVEATNPTPGTRHVGFASGWTMLTDAGSFVSVRSTAPFGSMWSPQVNAFLKEATAESRAFGFIMSTVSNTFGFSLFENGAVKRAMLNTMEEMIVVDDGEPLSVEKSAMQMTDKQSAILLLMELLEVPFRDFETKRFSVVAFETPNSA